MMPADAPRPRIRPSTLVLLALIAALGYGLVTQQRREARLRAALALYQARARDQILERIDEPISLTWPQESTLGQVIQELEGAAFGRRRLPTAFAISIDPAGLQQAGQSLAAPVEPIPPDVELTVREVLRRVLRPRGLACHIQGRSLVITSRQALERLRADEGALNYHEGIDIVK
jgi:hypothetical protein